MKSDHDPVANHLPSGEKATLVTLSPKTSSITLDASAAVGEASSVVGETNFDWVGSACPLQPASPILMSKIRKRNDLSGMIALPIHNLSYQQPAGR